MLKRMHLYMKERYPFIARPILGLIVFLEIHFIILLNEGITTFDIGIQEAVGAYTVFAFLLWLRIADDLKDFDVDKILFPDRPLARGAVFKKDVIILCAFFNLIAVVLHFVLLRISHEQVVLSKGQDTAFSSSCTRDSQSGADVRQSVYHFFHCHQI